MMARRAFRAGIRGALVLAGVVALMAGPAPAQNLFAPVARVNDQVVTAWELSQRMAFLQLLRAPGDVRALALEQLIDDRLKAEAARRMGISLTPEDLRSGMTEFAARANMTPDQFIAAIAQAGVAAETFRDFVGSGMLWRKAVRARFTDRARNVTDAEVDRALETAAPAPGARVLLTEIILPASTTESARASLMRAGELAKLTDPEDFTAAARIYSVAPSKSRDGDLGWKALASLPPEVAALIAPLEPGQITRPIKTEAGIVLYQLRERREVPAPRPGAEFVDYALYGVAGEQAAAIAAQVDGCEGLQALARGAGGEVERKVQPLAQVPAGLAGVLAGLDRGEVAPAPDGAGVVMLCARTILPPEALVRDEIRSGLQNRRLAELAAGWIADLRANAHIEYPR